MMIDCAGKLLSAVFINTALTASGVNVGSCWIKSAAAPATTVGAILVVSAPIAGCCNHHNPRTPGSFHRLTEWILRERLKHGAAQRKIDHANVVSVFQSDGALNSRNHI